MPRNYWMLVLSPDNFRVTRELGFTVQGFRSAQRRKADRMEVGDRLLFYISGIQRFGATATITSTFFEDHSHVWTSPKPDEEFPYRVRIEPATTLEDDELMDARQIGPRMEYVKRWIPEWWPMAFQGELHLIPRKDFTLIEDEMKRVASARARR
ncbi:MAG: EVE domain-containing protein [Chloroflexota bacterium]